MPNVKQAFRSYFASVFIQGSFTVFRLSLKRCFISDYWNRSPSTAWSVAEERVLPTICSQCDSFWLAFDMIYYHSRFEISTNWPSVTRLLCSLNGNWFKSIVLKLHFVFYQSISSDKYFFLTFTTWNMEIIGLWLCSTVFSNKALQSFLIKKEI